LQYPWQAEHPVMSSVLIGTVVGKSDRPFAIGEHALRAERVAHFWQEAQATLLDYSHAPYIYIHAHNEIS